MLVMRESFLMEMTIFDKKHRRHKPIEVFCERAISKIFLNWTLTINPSCQMVWYTANN